MIDEDEGLRRQFGLDFCERCQNDFENCQCCEKHNRAECVICGSED